MSKISLLKYAGLFFFRITFPFVEIRATKKKLHPQRNENGNGWTFVFNGRGKTSEPHHQICVFKMFVFGWGTFSGVRSVLDLSSGTYRKLIFKRMPGLDLKGVTEKNHAWRVDCVLFKKCNGRKMSRMLVSQSIPKGDVNISLVRFLKRTSAEVVLAAKVCAGVLI